MSKESYINIIDFGSSKIRFSVFDNKLNKIFFKSNSVSIDENFSNHFNFIDENIKKAEKEISSHIKDIILTLDSKDLFTINIALKKDLDVKTSIKKIYSNLLEELNRLISLHYSQYKILHTILDKCFIDNEHYLELPKNINKANNFKIEFKIICFKKNFLKFIETNFNKTNLNVKNIFCTSYIKSLFYSSKIGISKNSFLDIGWERTTFVIFENSKLKFIQSIPIGSFHITKDISKILKISISDAEKIKKSFNQSYTEFSYEKKFNQDNIKVRDIINKNISIDLLKKVILFRVQEIIDLTFKSFQNNNRSFSLEETDLFLIGDGSLLFNNNSFHINDNFKFKSINFYDETDNQVCESALTYYVNNYEIQRKTNKNSGIFEKFFNLFSK
tara:strand:- start:147 stop:1310 length:1164 start_codon:yes stop_codon:yes gene_type:complete